MSNVQQTQAISKAEVDLAAKRRAAAIKAAATRWSNRTATPEEQDLGRDMTPEETQALTPEQKKTRAKLRKAKWWRERYKAEKNGSAPPSTVSQHKRYDKKPEPTTQAVVVHVNQDHVPAEHRNLFTAEEIHAMRPMAIEDVQALPKAEYKIRTRLKARLYYAQRRESIGERQKAYAQRVSAKRRHEVATQPVEAIVTPANNAVPIKVHTCGVCGARHYAVKGNTE